VTYSIVARDAGTGDLGVAVQSHWFSVGSVVSWARPGVGAVATQSIAQPAYGPRLLDRLAAGEPPGAALAAELESDENAAVRQVAVIDASGTTAAHTGSRCIADAGDAQGAGFSVQANMMASEAVWPGMAAAFEASSGPLARRLLAALVAAEAAGGDVRGRQSAALVVVPPEGERWQRTADLRVEDSAEPLAELARLVDLDEAYLLMNEADQLSAVGRFDDAAERFVSAAALAPDNQELLFWGGLGMAQSGALERGAGLVRQAIDRHPGWATLLGRLEPEMAPSAEAVRRELGLDG
jgi:uncharacterized Ntn-hydrolase superfamily protein